jgi:hypothetical protein
MFHSQEDSMIGFFSSICVGFSISWANLFYGIALSDFPLKYRPQVFQTSFSSYIIL